MVKVKYLAPYYRAKIVFTIACFYDIFILVLVTQRAKQAPLGAFIEGHNSQDLCPSNKNGIFFLSWEQNEFIYGVPKSCQK